MWERTDRSAVGFCATVVSNFAGASLAGSLLTKSLLLVL